MENKGVKCDVAECTHNLNCCNCDLTMIEVTCKTSTSTSVTEPHFCKSYEAK